MCFGKEGRVEQHKGRTWYWFYLYHYHSSSIKQISSNNSDQYALGVLVRVKDIYIYLPDRITFKCAHLDDMTEKQGCYIVGIACKEMWKVKTSAYISVNDTETSGYDYSR